MKLFRPKNASALQPVRVVGGTGTVCTQIGDQISVRALGGGRTFKGAWKCTLVGDEVRVAQGFLNGLEPMIGGKFIGGKDAENIDYPDGPPLLRLKDDLYNETGRSWICIRVKVDATGKMVVKDYTADDLGIVQSKVPLLAPGLVGLDAVAMLRRSPEDTGWGLVRQIRWMDRQHGVSTTDNGMRHFFY